MNRLTSKRKTITITFISLTILVSFLKPILAHSGHDHSKPDTKSRQIEQEKNEITEENIQSFPTSVPKDTQQIENKTIDITLQETNQFNFIPQTAEIIFLLLIFNPLILKVIKQKLHQ